MWIQSFACLLACQLSEGHAYHMSDYDEKAEDAVDYEDIDEQYEGPEIQAATEEDFILPKKEYFTAQHSLSSLRSSTSVFDDDDYDEVEPQDGVADKDVDVQAIPSSGMLI